MDLYKAALKRAKRDGASRCDDAALLASICDGSLIYLVGAVSGRLVWEGAQRKGLTTKQVMEMAHRSPMAVAELQWVE